MLIRAKEMQQSARSRGFSLVELMVAMVLGLIVVGAVIALVLAMMRANTQTLRATRLTQELRATLAVVANDFKRARGVVDPLTEATQVTGNQLYVVNTATVGCLRYAYQAGVGGNWRSIRRDTATNRLLLTAASTQANATCTSIGVPLGSDQVAITSFTISPSSSSTTTRQYDITITGAIGSGADAITRTMRQTIFVRSLGDGT
ncbi:prepilin-type N-terminal cleavage/methylation domain-containing protein [Lysobacter niabensis]|uniref:Prepilin-type N-terminal cleavage/methylation domain-containing protein n=1 Tax=Agrilutibacter niabensis TaxID=380628 RepID=A0ABU1VLE5_9GAMM|nr:prepilin-type N-terminal cleavage/methylation domain-containing protein [Lysobacter niabensis]MDR7098093.1 prepilin-type N-terminal cleavage/methylation domain-containing protein [Lysobacter niabensis]